MQFAVQLTFDLSKVLVYDILEMLDETEGMNGAIEHLRDCNKLVDYEAAAQIVRYILDNRVDVKKELDGS